MALAGMGHGHTLGVLAAIGALTASAGCVSQPREGSAAGTAMASSRPVHLARRAVLYMPDRCLDLVDVVGVGVGWGGGPDLRVRVGRRAGAGLGLHLGGLIGVRSRSEYGGWFEYRGTARVGPYGPWATTRKLLPAWAAPLAPAAGYAIPCVLSIFGAARGFSGGGGAWGPDELWEGFEENMTSLGETEGKDDEIEMSCCMPALLLFDAPGHTGNLPGKPNEWYSGRLLHRWTAAGMHFAYIVSGPSVWLRIRTSEIPDFLGGFVGLDPRRDDVATPSEPTSRDAP